MPETTQVLLCAMQRAILDGDEAAARRLAAEAVQQGMPALQAIEQGFVPGLREAGAKWEEGEYFLPELVTAAQAMKGAMAVLQPRLEAGAEVTREGTVVIGTVQGDIHDIGKSLVATLLQANGFHVHDEGVDVPVDRFVARARELDADLVCASALLTTTMTMQRALAQAMRASGVRARLMVGGAPVTREWAATIGAAGFADNAVAAVQAARDLLSRRS